MPDIFTSGRPISVRRNVRAMSTDFGKRLKAARKHARLTQVQLSKLTGIGQSTISELESIGYGTTHIAKIAESCGVSPLWLEKGEGPMTAPSRAPSPQKLPGTVPLISSVQAGNWSEIVDNFQPGDAAEWIPCPAKHGPQTFALTVEGESMNNPGGRHTYEPGTVIFVDPGRAAAPGDRVVVRLEHQQQATFKQYIEEDGRKVLRALNPAWEPRFTEIDGDATICGVVIGKWVPE